MCWGLLFPPHYFLLSSITYTLHNSPALENEIQQFIKGTGIYRAGGVMKGGEEQYAVVQ